MRLYKLMHLVSTTQTRLRSSQLPRNPLQDAPVLASPPITVRSVHLLRNSVDSGFCSVLGLRDSAMLLTMAAVHSRLSRMFRCVNTPSSPASGHLSCFQAGAVMNIAAVNACTGLLVSVCMLSVGLPPGSGIAESSDTPVFGFRHYCQFSKVVVPIKTCVSTMRCPGTPHPPDMWD